MLIYGKEEKMQGCFNNLIGEEASRASEGLR
jgi:hypothetical protein